MRTPTLEEAESLFAGTSLLRDYSQRPGIPIVIPSEGIYVPKGVERWGGNRIESLWLETYFAMWAAEYGWRPLWICDQNEVAEIFAEIGSHYGCLLQAGIERWCRMQSACHVPPVHFWRLVRQAKTGWDEIQEKCIGQLFEGWQEVRIRSRLGC